MIYNTFIIEFLNVQLFNVEFDIIQKVFKIRHYKNRMRKALITGITGQDGYFLSKLLLSKDYDVYGIIRRNSSMHQGTLEKLSAEERKLINIFYGDITDNNFIIL